MSSVFFNFYINYAKYILKETSDIEKRELLGCLKSKVELNNKNIYIN